MDFKENKNFKMDEVCDTKGYKRLTGYRDAVTKIEFICNKGHSFSMLPSGILKGNKCNICTGKSPEHQRRLFEDFVKSTSFEIIETYKHSIVKVKLKCKHGHYFSVYPSDFRKSVSCTVCSGKNKDNAKRNFKNNIGLKGWKLLDSYVNSKHLHNVICDKGHHISIRPNDLHGGVGCGKCKQTGYRSSLGGYLYLVLWDNGTSSFLKYGITNKGAIRIQQQQSRQGVNNYQPDILVLKFFSDGKIPFKIEKEIKDLRLPSTITKADFNDGWSETLDINEDSLSKIKSILNLYEISFSLPHK
ncbi:hypothetical protein NVP1084O_225 [Vibrio phage 1.084.O._10N.261.49.F5]|nr:hypothetical protein NVP1084O_225 [Vibrio phage 1.084.O._10N.261.49.F5]